MRLNKHDIRERIKDTLMETLKMEFIETDDPNTLEATMPVSKFNSQTMGVLHGGATIALAETVAGVGSNVICNDDEACYGMQVSASHISSAKIGDKVRAYAVIEHKGRSSHVWNVNVISENTSKLISTVRVTNFVVKKRVS